MMAWVDDEPYAEMEEISDEIEECCETSVRSLALSFARAARAVLAASSGPDDEASCKSCKSCETRKSISGSGTALRVLVFLLSIEPQMQPKQGFTEWPTEWPKELPKEGSNRVPKRAKRGPKVGPKWGQKRMSRIQSNRVNEGAEDGDKRSKWVQTGGI